MTFKLHHRLIMAIIFSCAITQIATADEKSTVDSSQNVSEDRQRYGMPGEHHQILNKLIGTWTHTIKWRMAADAKFEESQGTTENRWILGNRFVYQEIKGEMMGQPFEGLGIMGYDTMRGEYISVWLDNMGTGIMTSSSRFNPKRKTFTETGEFSCPMTGETNKPYRAVLKLVDKNHYRYEMYTTDQNGKEFKSVDIRYDRVK